MVTKLKSKEGQKWHKLYQMLHNRYLELNSNYIKAKIKFNAWECSLCGALNYQEEDKCSECGSTE